MRKIILQPTGGHAPVETPVEVTLERAGDASNRTHLVTVGQPGGGGHPIEVEIASRDDGGAGRAGHLRIRGRIMPFHARRDGDVVRVWVRGRTGVFEIVPRTAQREAAGRSGGSTGDLTAPMPGKILEIRVGPGDAFAAHAPIVVMESMKMEMTLSSPNAGRVRELLCKEGELVEMGTVLARLEPRGSDAEGVGGVS